MHEYEHMQVIHQLRVATNIHRFKSAIVLGHNLSCSVFIQSTAYLRRFHLCPVMFYDILVFILLGLGDISFNVC